KPMRACTPRLVLATSTSNYQHPTSNYPPRITEQCAANSQCVHALNASSSLLRTSNLELRTSNSHPLPCSQAISANPEAGNQKPETSPQPLPVCATVTFPDPAPAAQTDLVTA